jgi:hypothetical protein
MPPSTTVETPSLDIIGSLALAIVNFFPCATGSTSASVGGFELAIGSFNFHIDDTDISRLLSVVESTMPAIDSVAPSPAVIQQVIEENFAPVSALPSPGTDQAPESSSPSVRSNTFQDPPLSPTTTYCIDCDAYHFVGTRDFSSHEIFGCEDPCEGTTAIYPMISECQRALDALSLHPTPYDPNYVEGLYSYYTCSDDDF